MTPRLLYVFDPLCGWCYAAGPLLRAVAARFGNALEVDLLPGLLFSPARRIDPQSTEHILQADRRIAELTRLPFGEAYLARLQQSPGPVFDSQQPAAAILAVAELAPRHALGMLEAVQRAHYVTGLDVSSIEVLHELAGALGVAADDFTPALHAALNALPARAARARSVLQAAGGQGFPTFVLEVGGRHIRVDHAAAYSQPSLLAERLDSLLHTYARFRLKAPIESVRRVLASAAHANSHP